MIGLWDTTGIEVVKALANERRSAGGLTSGLALTLVAVVDERQVREAEAAATIAASAHPCRLLIIVRADVTQQRSRLDAEIVVGGRLGPCEAVVMRMQGRLALHAESVVMPLLAPDVPVVTWWQCTPPERIAYDPLGVVADRRITDSSQAADPVGNLRTRADDYVPGDTDLAWSRITPWRTLLAGAFDATTVGVKAVEIVAPDTDPTGPLLGGWLEARLGVHPTRRSGSGKIMEAVHLELADGSTMSLNRDLNAGSATLQRTGQPDRILPLSRRPLGEELAEELRRLDPDQPYAAALAAATGKRSLEERVAPRVHIWKDPALAERPEASSSTLETVSS
ncbi:glucose-6-phosphate dehydrogenase assembly protein OpcA [Dactylosporangium sp. NPDC005555]|uniref:glucose-6-phosphate dehydrogenase assembly protein OpcA n=1 Tax=Dactylosporangium sp. NPDC005555 TaxID=3154889 RepID=UPI0033AB6047